MTRYFLLLGICVVLTLPLEFVFHARVYARIHKALRAIWLPSSVYLIWDYFATKYDHWAFADAHTVSFKLLGLPLEEYLFFLIIPLCALLTFEAVSRLLKSSIKAKWFEWISYALLFCISGLAVSFYRVRSFDIVYPDRIFPYYCLATLAISTFLIFYCAKSSARRDLIKSRTYFLTIAICLFFMVFINGFLTILDDPVVTYKGNIGLRLFLDIPVEDFFYGTALMTWIILRWAKLTNYKIDDVETKLVP